MRRRPAIKMYAVASVLAFAVLAATDTPCQVVPSWATILDDGGRSDTANQVAIDPAGAIIVGGTSIGQNSFGLRVAKLDPSGTVIWSNVYAFGGGLDVTEGVVGMTVDGAGDILTVCRENTRVVTMKVSGAGAELWRAIYDTPGFDRPAGIVSDEAGRTYVGGTTIVGQPPAQTRSAFIVSYDANGNLLWQDQYDSKNNQETIYDIARDPVSGAVYLAGELETQFGGLGRESPLLVRYAPDGRRLWAKHYRKPGTIALAQKAVVGPDGNVVLAGQYLGDNFQVIKVDGASGKDLWTALYSEPTYDQFIDVAVDGSGNVFVSGHVESQPEQLPIFSHAVLLRYTADGALSWSVVDDRIGDLLGLLAVDASGSAYAAASWLTTGYDATGQRIWTAAYDSGPGISPPGPNKGLVITPAGDMILAGTGGLGDIHVVSYRLP
jgi:putative pyrroloquinoline-quinone binding quinoprotein